MNGGGKINLSFKLNNKISEIFNKKIMPKLKEVIPLFERLVDGKANEIDEQSSEIQLFHGNGIGYSQFNEILLLLGFKRVSYEFFQYLADGRYNYKPDTSIESVEQLKYGIERFIILSLLFYGNIKFAYKELSSNSEELYDKILESLPTDIEKFQKRHKPIREIIPISPDKTYFLGYLIENELKNRLKNNPDDIEAVSLEKDRKKYVKIAENNQITYLASDHLDVYVATSMRAKHDFLFVNKTIKKIFEDTRLIELNLRYFDPTQAYCINRIDKGLSEALMLKTALCTLYLAQESETLGKDSELASTLAQGKAVIAYVPDGTKEFVDELIAGLINNNQSNCEKEIILEQLKVYSPCLAWENDKIRAWINDIKNASLLEMKNQLYTLAENYYDGRAKTLKENHPLGIQVNLNSGVANGVLVVRTIEDCIKLIRNVVLNEMEFSIKINMNNDDGYIYLQEKISGCIFRLKTGNTLLTNTFWNFYTKD
jgi:hypothetical protein